MDGMLQVAGCKVQHEKLEPCGLTHDHAGNYAPFVCCPILLKGICTLRAPRNPQNMIKPSVRPRIGCGSQVLRSMAVQ